MTTQGFDAKYAEEVAFLNFKNLKCEVRKLPVISRYKYELEISRLYSRHSDYSVFVLQDFQKAYLETLIASIVEPTRWWQAPRAKQLGKSSVYYFQKAEDAMAVNMLVDLSSLRRKYYDQ